MVATVPRAREAGELRTRPTSAGRQHGRQHPHQGRHPYWHLAALSVLVTGLAATAALAGTTYRVNSSNEDRLLRQRVREAGAVLSQAVSGVQTPLAASAELVESTNADPAAFRRLVGPLVGQGKSFVSASVWVADGSILAPLIVVGQQPAIAALPPTTQRAFLARTITSPTIAVLGLLEYEDARIGYGFSSPRTPNKFVVYTEGALPENRTAVAQQGSAYAALDYALYLRTAGTDRRELLYASTSRLPLIGHQASTAVPFGDTRLDLVMTPKQSLGGPLLQWLWLWVSIGGVLISLGAAALTERLARGRMRAEDLAHRLAAVATVNAELFARQRSVSHTLQQSLLPRTIPHIAGLEVATRYQPGVSGLEVGGDWYDVMPLGEERVLVVVGDVSGRGLEAATVMAALRYSVRAFASQGDSPATILSRLGPLIDLDRDGHFATVLCGVLDVATGTLTAASAGHPRPLVLDAGRATFIELVPGPPVGVPSRCPYAEATVLLPPDATLVMFTDGLFERRHECIDAGLERLRATADGWNGPVEGLLGMLVERVAPSNSDDDTALMGIKMEAVG